MKNTHAFYLNCFTKKSPSGRVCEVIVKSVEDPRHGGHQSGPKVPHVLPETLHAATIKSDPSYKNVYVSTSSFLLLPLTSSKDGDHLTAALQGVAHGQVGEHDVTCVGGNV